MPLAAAYGRRIDYVMPGGRAAFQAEPGHAECSSRVMKIDQRRLTKGLKIGAAGTEAGDT